MCLTTIVSQLYKDRRVNEFISKQQPCHLQGDLLHHCILEVYRINDKYPGKIEALNDRNELWAWFHGLVCRQLHSTKSTFYTRYRRTYLPEEHIPAETVSINPFETETQETLAEAKHGSGFIDYFYREFPKRDKKKIIKQVQISMF